MQAPLVVGIDLGGSHVTAAVVDAAGTVWARAKRDIDRHKPAAALLGDDVASTVRDAVQQAGLSLREIVSIGMGLPGNIDRARGVCRFSPNFGWRDVEVAKPLEQVLEVPVYLLNDVRSHTLGELHFGAGKGVASFVMLALGTGIGGGIVIGGRLLEGSHSGGGELGHITVEPDGPACGCGSHGCVEALGAAPALARAGREAVAAGKAPGLAALAGSPEAIQGSTITQAAQAGDVGSLEVLAQVGRYVGIAVASVITTLDPDLVLIGGGVAAAGDLLLEPLRAEVGRRCRMIPEGATPIRRAALLEEAGVMGAAALALEACGHLPAALEHCVHAPSAAL
jgi:glucokinase